MKFNEFLAEKKNKTKEMSGYDYYKSVRKPTPPTGTAFKDKKKYDRKQKHSNRDMYEESRAGKDYYRQISDALSSKGLKAFEQAPILKIVERAIKLAFNEGYKAGVNQPFR